MSKGVNIFSVDWIELVFEGKNKEFGAFVLRKESNKRHRLALIIAVSLFTLAILSPMIIDKLTPVKKERSTEVTQLVKLDQPEQKEEEVRETPPPPKVATIAFPPPVITEENVEDDMKTQEDLNKETTVIGVVDQEGLERLPDMEELTADVGTVKEEIYEFVEEDASFPGGQDAMYDYLRKCPFPQAAQELGEEGNLTLKFVIGSDGKVRDVHVVESSNKIFNDAAIKHIKNMPAWAPAKNSGKAVSQYYTLPWVFQF